VYIAGAEEVPVVVAGIERLEGDAETTGTNGVIVTYPAPDW